MSVEHIVDLFKATLSVSEAIFTSKQEASETNVQKHRSPLVCKQAAEVH